MFNIQYHEMGAALYSLFIDLKKCTAVPPACTAFFSISTNLFNYEHLKPFIYCANYKHIHLLYEILYLMRSCFPYMRCSRLHATTQYVHVSTKLCKLFDINILSNWMLCCCTNDATVQTKHNVTLYWQCMQCDFWCMSFAFYSTERVWVPSQVCPGMFPKLRNECSFHVGT